MKRKYYRAGTALLAAAALALTACQGTGGGYDRNMTGNMITLIPCGEFPEMRS